MKLDYYREIPNESEAVPGGALFLLNHGSKEKIISATILDLAVKKYIEFEIKNDKKKKEIQINIVENTNPDTLKESEKIVYALLENVAKDNSFTMKDFEKYVEINETKFRKKMTDMDKAIVKEQEEMNNFDIEKRKEKQKVQGRNNVYCFFLYFLYNCSSLK